MALLGLGACKTSGPVDPVGPQPAASEQSPSPEETTGESSGSSEVAGAAGAAPDDFVGVWQDAPEMGSGWSNVYVFFSDGRFEYHGADECERVAERAGHFRLGADALVVTEERERVREGGTRTDDPVVGCELEGAVVKTVTHESPAERRILLDACSDADTDRNDMIPCRRISGDAYWRFSDDPGFYPEQE